MDKPYSPLPGPDYIRLLDISVRVRWLSRELVCAFGVVPLNDDLPDYTAVSFCWGDQAEVTRLKFSDGRSLPLSHAPSDLFGQNDLEEKASQVRRIGLVFSPAKQVFRWLGESDETSRVAFRVMKSRDRDPAGYCVFGVWIFFEGLGRSEVEGVAARGLWSVTRLIHVRQEYRRHEEVRCETLLQAAFRCEAADRRDMVFLSRGFADSPPVTQPNDTVLEEEVYVATARALLRHREALDPLALCGTGGGERSPSLLTGAPDLRHRSHAEPLVLCYRAGWDVDGPLRDLPRIKIPLRLCLRGQGCRLRRDLPAIRLRFGSETAGSGQRAAGSGRRRPGAEAATARRRFGRGVDGPTGHDAAFGLGIDDLPLDEQETLRYRAYFREWFDRLHSSSSHEDLGKITQRIPRNHWATHK
ncbi:hypothetical protein DL766_000525 [Monosporascus sp. MC13-8B]|uniref:Heterokaryon incompatibility domain-containing protein n=1 Tax=Monosporascus cannonballus TaxID=155416 RepID=A0ABY0GXW0_9PEZI|nr:hypothetical protein DL762_007873 [Monosporascus cannonballus]RYO82804.1 hypothetical protein DL763_008118 [Monosporascus cannonballus]RYP39155.1 hypothetical protein DL766_000525 [Monosporascus sp. MC13-8B]